MVSLCGRWSDHQIRAQGPDTSTVECRPEEIRTDRESRACVDHVVLVANSRELSREHIKLTQYPRLQSLLSYLYCINVLEPHWPPEFVLLNLNISTIRVRCNILLTAMVNTLLFEPQGGVGAIWGFGNVSIVRMVIGGCYSLNLPNTVAM